MDGRPAGRVNQQHTCLKNKGEVHEATGDYESLTQYTGTDFGASYEFNTVHTVARVHEPMKKLTGKIVTFVNTKKTSIYAACLLRWSEPTSSTAS